MDQIKSAPGELRLKRMRIPHIRPIWIAGFAVWSVLLGIGIFAILWQPAPPERGSLALGSTDAPVTVVEFSDFT